MNHTPIRLLTALAGLAAACLLGACVPAISTAPTAIPAPRTPTSTRAPIPAVTMTAAPPTATAARATATAVPAATPGVILQDDFSQPSPAWITGRTPNGTDYEFQDGAYRISMPVDATQFSIVFANAADLSIEVDANLSGGPDDGRYGVFCRGDQSGKTGYLFEVSPANLYGIYRNDRDTPLAIAQYQGQTDAIKPGRAVNHLRADCVGTTLRLTVNGRQLLEVQDSTFARGALGLLVASGVGTRQGADAAFHNFLARAADAAALPTTAPTAPATPAAFGRVLLQDDFSNPASGWTRRDEAGVSADYAAGAYRISIDKDDTRVKAFHPANAADVSVEADVTLSATPGFDAFGLICRARDESDFYSLSIGSDGFWGISKVIGDRSIDLAVHESEQPSAIKPGLSTNHLRADCAGSTLRLTVNGQLLDEVHDADLPRGDVGLRAYSDKGFDVLFKNYIVRAP